MQQALERVQHDLDAAGLGQRVLRFALAGETFDDPIVILQWSGGRGGSHTDDVFDLGCDDAAMMTADVAEAAAQGLIEAEGLYWPTCPVHASRGKAALGEEHVAVWVCSKRGITPHALAPVGKLAELPAQLRHGTPLYLRLSELGSP
jgi:hypothetical protein